MKFKRMGVINITPDSFSDGGEALTPGKILTKIESFGEVEALDIGAESTAPMNKPISWTDEWERWKIVLNLLPALNVSISADTYHPETIFALVKFWKDRKLSQNLIWNDVSGKFDGTVKDFLKEGDRFHYVLCHNRAPSRDLSGKHMDYVKVSDDLFEEYKTFFLPHAHVRVIFDPCLGFSKSYEENWQTLNEFSGLQKVVPHSRWLLGFSRKSFFRKKLNLELSQIPELDSAHIEYLQSMMNLFTGEVFIRTHRPELITRANNE